MQIGHRKVLESVREQIQPYKYFFAYAQINPRRVVTAFSKPSSDLFPVFSVPIKKENAK